MVFFPQRQQRKNPRSQPSMTFPSNTQSWALFTCFFRGSSRLGQVSVVSQILLDVSLLLQPPVGVLWKKKGPNGCWGCILGGDIGFMISHYRNPLLNSQDSMERSKDSFRSSLGCCCKAVTRFRVFPRRCWFQGLKSWFCCGSEKGKTLKQDLFLK